MTVSFSEDQTWRAEARSGYLEGTYQVTKPGKLATLSLDPDVARSAIEASASDRITSYNVCYTKLLRDP